MPRRKSPELAVRNEVIYAKWRSGQSLVSLGQEYKRAPQVIGRIVANFHPESDEDGERSLFRGYLWRLFDEVRDVYANPGFKMSPTGRPAVGPDDEPAEDVMCKLEAAKLQLAVLESLRKLDARDRVQPKQLTVQFDVAHRAMQADLEQKKRELLEAQRAVQSPVIRGEIEKPDQQRGEEGDG